MNSRCLHLWQEKRLAQTPLGDQHLHHARAAAGFGLTGSPACVVLGRKSFGRLRLQQHSPTESRSGRQIKASRWVQRASLWSVGKAKGSADHNLSVQAGQGQDSTSDPQDPGPPSQKQQQTDKGQHKARIRPSESATTSSTAHLFQQSKAEAQLQQALDESLGTAASKSNVKEMDYMDLLGCDHEDGAAAPASNVLLPDQPSTASASSSEASHDPHASGQPKGDDAAPPLSGWDRAGHMLQNALNYLIGAAVAIAGLWSLWSATRQLLQAVKQPGFYVSLLGIVVICLITPQTPRNNILLQSADASHLFANYGSAKRFLDISTFSSVALLCCSVFLMGMYY